MSVDERRETFHVNRIAPSDLDERLLAQGYRPDVVAAVRTLVSKGAKPLSVALDGRLTQGRTPEYGDDGDLCLKTRNVVGGLVNISSVDRVSAQFASANIGTRIANETVLMNRSGAGSIGRVSIYIGADSVFTNEELFRFRIAAPHDPAFVAVFFGTSLGERVLERGVNGSTGQLKLVQEHVQSVPVFLPHPLAQRYIGDKVRQAEQLRERARTQRTILAALLQTESLSAALATENHRSSRVRASDLNARLDAKYYGPQAMAVLHAAGQDSKTVGAMIEEVSNGFEHRTFAEAGTAYVTVSEVSGGRLVLDAAPQIPANVAVPDKARIDARCALVVRTGSIGVAVKVFEEDAHAVISSHLIRLRCASDAHAALVAAYLNCDAGRLLLRKISYGAVQPQIGQEELLALPIPGSILERADAVLMALEVEDAALRAAARLTDAAKQLVEHLIEGTISETDLVAAQQALESGDRAADRALLQHLRQGSGKNAAPLFADLDGLYDLLDADDHGSGD